MSARANHFQTIPDLIKLFSTASFALEKSSLDPRLKCLIDLRASQLNGCTFCVDMHSKQAKIKGESELRLYHVAAWRESPLFSAKEKAVFALTEALTDIAPEGVDDDLYRQVAEHFSEKEISEIAYAIGSINMWNRLQILSQIEAGSLDKTFGLTKAGLS